MIFSFDTGGHFFDFATKTAIDGEAAGGCGQT